VTNEERELAVKVAKEMVSDAMFQLADDTMGFSEMLWGERPEGIEDETFEEMLTVFDEVVAEAREILGV
jgi:hypothetical protein